MEELYMTTRTLSVLFNKNMRTIQRWIRDCKPKQKDGKYYAPDLMAYYERKLTAKKKDKEELEIALKQVKLEREKFNLEKEKGEYVKREEVEVEWAQRVAELKSGLLALEFRLSSQLANRKRSLAKVREIVKKEVLDLLWSYVRDGKYTPQLNETLTLQEQEKLFWEFMEKLAALDSCKSVKVEVKCFKKKRKK